MKKKGLKGCLKPITSIGLVCTDHIFIKKKGKTKYITSAGGGSAGNTIIYLALSNQKTNIIGVIGDDKPSRVALQDFERLNVDTSGIITRARSSTKQYAHIINEGYARDHDFKKKCPVCSSSYMKAVQFRNSYLEKKHHEIVRNSRLVHIDRISESYLKLAKMAKDRNIPVVVDLGTIYRRFTRKETIEKAIKYADIIQIPESNEKFVQEKLGITSFWDINQEIKGWVVTANNGKMRARVKDKGMEQVIQIPVPHVKNVVDTGGAGDTFLAHFILALNEKTDNFSQLGAVTAKDWKQAVSTAGKIASESCRYYGARGYLYSMLAKQESLEKASKLSIIKKYGEQLGTRCPCKIKGGGTSSTGMTEVNLVKLIKKRKGKNLFETNMLNIPEYVSWSLTHTQRNGFSSKDHNNLVFVGSGGSYTVATTLSHIFQSFNYNQSQALTPLDYILRGKERQSVVLISAGGTNPDIKASFKRAKDLKSEKIFLLTANQKSKLYALVNRLDNGKNLLMRTPWREKGFVSVLELISSIIYGAKEIIGEKWIPQYDELISEKQLMNMLNDVIRHIRGKYGDILANKDDFKLSHLIGLGSGWSWPAVIDLESKVVESGISTIEISELKNYTHGRYLSLFKNPEGKMLVLYKTPKTAALVDFLVEKLSNIAPAIVLETDKENFYSTIELLIQTYALCNEIGLQKKIDLAKPDYPEEARGLYEWDRIYK